MGLLMVNPEFAAARSLRTRNLRFIVRRSLLVVHCSLFIARCSLRGSVAERTGLFPVF